MAKKKYKISSTSKFRILASKRTSLETQKVVTIRARQFSKQVVVVRTFLGSFVGCIVDVIRGAILLRVFSGFDRKFIVIRIPVFLIFDIFPFKCL